MKNKRYGMAVMGAATASARDQNGWRTSLNGLADCRCPAGHAW